MADWRKSAKGREHVRQYNANYRRQHPHLMLLGNARKRARFAGLPCTITADDVPIPTVCPVLGIAIEVGVGSFHDASPSIDRLIPDLGYVPGNVRVISMRANRLKSDATTDEVRRVLAYMEQAIG